MAVGNIAVTARLPLRVRVRELLDREQVLGPLFVTPALFLLVLLVAYPFCMALYFSVSDAFIGRPSHVIGWRNFNIGYTATMAWVLLIVMSVLFTLYLKAFRRAPARVE